jgi:hypothetical protein
MTSYAERLAQELRTSYEGRDRDALERALRRMVATMHYTGPVEERKPSSDACARKLLGCECTTHEQRSQCMFRAA